MSYSFDLSIEISEPYEFSKDALHKIAQNLWVKNQWPLVYLIQNLPERVAYVGESTNALSRIRTHLATPKKANIFKTISIIGSDKFNKSATLDIESYLIQYLMAEGTYRVQNGNYGLINHNYYQQDLYKQLFKEIWNKLMAKKIVTKSLSEIENLEVFKYSPYKSLNEDQYNSVLEILNGLTIKKSNRIFVQGSAGTGKTILATYLIKLLHSDLKYESFDDFNEDEIREINYIKAFREKYPNAKIGLVVAMTSLRESLKNVFRQVPGLKSSMVMSPSDVTKKGDYDLLIVDEAHRLRQYRNIGWLGEFKKTNQRLGLGDDGTELDWILKCSKNQIFFYDSDQSVKPSDIDQARFIALLEDSNTLKLQLVSQMRVQGGNNYIKFVDDLLHTRKVVKNTYSADAYDLMMFDSLDDLYHKLYEKEKLYGLCRLIAGYAWEWRSKKDKGVIDIELDGLRFRWNQTDSDWINTPNAFKEVGCIHTVQGYDLNYTGVIFGKEIDYNPSTNQVEVNPKLYFDINGKKGANTPDLKAYIINIYKTIMYRGIKGTFVYACNQNLRDYLKRYIPVYKATDIPFRILRKDEVKPYVNCVPLIDISAAAGSFSDLQLHLSTQWIELPVNIAAREGYFVCQVVGESMNKRIPNGSYCLFRQDDGGSRNGKIVLVESTDFIDVEFGSRYTVKEYHSEKQLDGDQWMHQSIVLKPLSNSSEFHEIRIDKNESSALRIVGLFERVLV
ncbi:MAG TPA: DNA/RNA helicase domain-containing protein [Ohtaekwangia sp.]|uniref:DNA/RNA helicase domain-containing protein n=1 Tax=Ohtaekwangia sp. TaxID=2066019 RepID=UPI002F949100